MDQARRESPNGGLHSALRLVVLTPAQIVAPRPAERAPGAVRRRPPTTATALLYALLKLVGYGPPPSFGQLPGLTWLAQGSASAAAPTSRNSNAAGSVGARSDYLDPGYHFRNISRHSAHGFSLQLQLELLGCAESTMRS